MSASGPTTQTVLLDLYEIILQRKLADPKHSYVAQLYHKGRGEILRKVDEEAFEVVMAGKDDNPAEVIHEAADLLFHLWVMLADMDIHPDVVFQELLDRFGTSGLSMAAVPRRTSERRTHNKQLTLNMFSGLTLMGATTDVSMEGLQLEIDYEPKWQLIGERGFFEIEMPPDINPTLPTTGVRIEVGDQEFQVHLNQGCLAHGQDFRFEFEVVRVTDNGIGLRIVDNLGLFTFALSKDAFKDAFRTD
ncbi:MAG: phosphoribosyl-ATP diphosphatase [Magnetococcales bacterium]|nr:phosphoribosyl-ATP diphosphatase [Magnetococcales bacterium]